jgi:hypothetical protein
MLTHFSPAGLAVALLLTQSTSAPPVQAAWSSFPDKFSARLRNCDGCKAGEAMAVSVVTIPHSKYVDIDSPPCADPVMMQPALPADVKGSVAKMFYSQPVKTAQFALGLSDVVPAGRAPSARISQIGGWGGLRKAAGLHQTSSCARNVVVVPRMAVVTRVEKSMQCPAGGWCGHQFEPFSEDLDPNLRAYTVVGKNWSHDTNAATILRVFYTR